MKLQSSERPTQHTKREIDLSGLQNYQINTKEDWNNWQFRDEEYENIPLGFMNKFNFHKNLKFCDPSSIQPSQQQANYMIVQENIKKKNKDFISKNAKMNETKIGYSYRKIYNKKWQRNPKHWTNQMKTNFKKITVKNNWTEIKSISKNNLQNLPQVKNFHVNNFKTIGSVCYVNPAVQRIAWEQTRFKENKVYTVSPIVTANDKTLLKVAGQLLEQKDSKRINIICNPAFLFALLTVRAGVYPWNIEVQKVGNTIVLQNFKNAQDENQKLSYLDLFTVNENTSNNMPTEQSKVRQACITATKMTKIFQDLLASGDQVNIEDIQQHYQENQSKKQDGEQNQGQDGDEQEQEEEQSKQQLEKLRKYLKITADNIDIYSYVEIDGVKKNNTTGQLQPLLIRTFFESESQGAWVKDMKTPGLIINKQHPSNSCSIQKWICEAHLAGVQDIKTGYIGYTHNKNLALLNVDQVSVKGLENTLSFKYGSCWSAAKYIFDLLANLEDGTYVLAKNPYSPLSIKLFLTKSAADDEEYEEEEGEGDGRNDASNDKN